MERQPKQAAGSTPPWRSKILNNKGFSYPTTLTRPASGVGRRAFCQLQPHSLKPGSPTQYRPRTEPSTLSSTSCQSSRDNSHTSPSCSCRTHRRCSPCATHAIPPGRTHHKTVPSPATSACRCTAAGYSCTPPCTAPPGCPARSASASPPSRRRGRSAAPRATRIRPCTCRGQRARPRAALVRPLLRCLQPRRSGCLAARIRDPRRRLRAIHSLVEG